MSFKEEEWKEEEMAFNEYYNSEHNRLRDLWRDVHSVKRLFADMKFATERDLSKMRGEMNGLANDTLTACSSTSFFLKLQAAANAASSSVVRAAQPQHQTERNQAATEEAAAKLEQALAEVRSRDERIQQLLREVNVQRILFALSDFVLHSLVRSGVYIPSEKVVAIVHPIYAGPGTRGKMLGSRGQHGPATAAAGGHRHPAVGSARHRARPHPGRRDPGDRHQHPDSDASPSVAQRTHTLE